MIMYRSSRRPFPFAGTGAADNAIYENVKVRSPLETSVMNYPLNVTFYTLLATFTN